MTTPDRPQSKTLLQSMNVDQKSLETELVIAICSPTGDKWQSKTLFLAIFYSHTLIVKSVFDCRLSSVMSVSIPRQTSTKLFQGDYSLLYASDLRSVDVLVNSLPSG